MAELVPYCLRLGINFIAALYREELRHFFAMMMWLIIILVNKRGCCIA